MESGGCCSPDCLRSTLCPAHDRVGPLRFPGDGAVLSRWLSPDTTLKQFGIKHLQLGGDTWNRCGMGWLNIDGNFDVGDGVRGPNRIFTDDTERHNMKHIVSEVERLPFKNNSVQFVYSEHMLEHLLPSEGGVQFLREAYRVLAPGGVLRLVTPDLAKYMCAYVDRTGPARGFLEQHAARFTPMEHFGKPAPPSRATVVNNIFRNYGHKWVYDFAEVRQKAARAGINPADICRSDRFDATKPSTSGLGLPRWVRQVMRRANQPRNESQTCWLDQEVREGESMYLNIFKQAQPAPRKALGAT
jgi:predicted SAM-dependent methyltransferase